MKGVLQMQRNFRVECRSYDQALRGSWQAYKLDTLHQLGDEVLTNADDCTRLWLPSRTLMNWSTGSRPLRRNCLQFFWPHRWYMLSAFYQEDVLVHTYATVIQPPTIEIDRIAYVDLELSVLVKPDQSYEVLTQVEFEHAAETLRYNEETRLGALMALNTLTSSIQRSVGIFAMVPYLLKQTEIHLAACADN